MSAAATGAAIGGREGLGQEEPVAAAALPVVAGANNLLMSLILQMKIISRSHES